MIYNIPLEDKHTNLQNHDDIDLELEACSNLDKTEDYELANSENPEDQEEELGESQELGGMAHDWSQVNQVGSKEQKLDEWLIDSGASVHVTNQKEDLGRS